MTAFRDDLIEIISRRQATVVVGSGVSIATSDLKYASWIGLLENGINRCAEKDSTFNGPAQHAVLANSAGHLPSMLGLATTISMTLKGFGGEYARWLKDTVGQLKRDHPELLHAIAGLGLAIATTNYDSLLEQETGLPYITWTNHGALQDFLRGNRQFIAHLHGYFEEPESVIFDEHGYANLADSLPAQAAQQFLAMSSSLIFVGCGDGLLDPNFSSLCDWIATRMRAGVKIGHSTPRERRVAAE